MHAHRLREMRAHRPTGRAQHQPPAHHEPRVVVDTGQHLRLPAVRQQHPADHVHLPQLHRPAPLPPLELAVPLAPRGRIDQVGPLQQPVDPRPRRHRIDTRPDRLMDQPPGPPVRVAAPGLQHPHLDRWIHLMRAPRRPMRPIRQPAQPLRLVPAQPPMHRLPRHVEPTRHLDNRDTIAPDSRSQDVTHQAEPSNFRVGRRGLEPRTYGLKAFPITPQTSRISSDCNGFRPTRTLPEPPRPVKKGPPPRA